MVATESTYGLLAAMFAYPDGNIIRAAEQCGAALRGGVPEAADHLDKFIEIMKDKTIEEREEAHIRVFDWNPHCALELGWHLFGEDYSRGAFLVRMRERMRALGVEEDVELPDHITHALAVTERMPPEDADDFVTACVLPAVHKMIEGLARLDETPYRHILEAVRLYLEYGHQSVAEDES